MGLSKLAQLVGRKRETVGKAAVVLWRSLRGKVEDGVHDGASWGGQGRGTCKDGRWLFHCGGIVVRGSIEGLERGAPVLMRRAAKTSRHPPPTFNCLPCNVLQA